MNLLTLNIECSHSECTGTRCTRQSQNSFEFTERGGCIGRSRECDWVIDCAEQLLSRRHALISFHSNRFWLTDLSTNGVFRNGSTTAIGCGNSAAIAMSDRFRLGSVRMVAAINAETHNAPAADSAKRSRPSRSDHDAAAIPDRTAATSSLLPGLGSTSDNFQPAKVFIPDDWVGDIASPGEPAPPPAACVNRRLSALQQAASGAFWRQLLPGATDEHECELTPEMAALAGRGLRRCLEAMVTMRAEFTRSERWLRGMAAELDVEPDAEVDRICRSLLDEQLGDDQLAELESWQQEMAERHTALLEAIGDAASRVADQFAPERIEAEWQAASEEQGLFARRLARRALKPSQLWHFYVRWYREQKHEELTARWLLSGSALAESERRADDAADIGEPAETVLDHATNEAGPDASLDPPPATTEP